MLTTLAARSPDEQHRTSTPLELFLDLCFVVAVAQAAASLHHAIAADHVAAALIGYPMVFFAIWWAWMNFTWFASAYDNDDVGYRLAVFVQVFGVLVVAAGIGAAFDERDFTLIVVGYVIMRLALVGMWLRAARSDPLRRGTALRYAGGVAGAQLLWIGFLFVPAAVQLPVFLVLVAIELGVPVWAERLEPTTWHPHHIAERYGLFTIIVLGESILGITLAVKAAVDSGEALQTLAATAVGGVLVVCAMWWLYFSEPSGEIVTRMRARFEASDARSAFIWGYGHYVIFMAAAAAGAGIAVVVDTVSHHAHTSLTTATTALAVPVAVYVVCMWLLHRHHERRSAHDVAYLGAAVAVVVYGMSGLPIIGIGAILVGLIAVTVPRRG